MKEIYRLIIVSFVVGIFFVLVFMPSPKNNHQTNINLDDYTNNNQNLIKNDTSQDTHRKKINLNDYVPPKKTNESQKKETYSNTKMTYEVLNVSTAKYMHSYIEPITFLKLKPERKGAIETVAASNFPSGYLKTGDIVDLSSFIVNERLWEFTGTLVPRDILEQAYDDTNIESEYRRGFTITILKEVTSTD